MTKSKKKNNEEKKLQKNLRMLSVMKEGVHLIGSKPNQVVAIMRKVKFPAIQYTNNDSGNKYYNQRFSLFSKYDEGIRMDSESWYSVTHEVIAKHIARTCMKCSIIMDGFAGVGGNVISFAEHCRVIAVDIDPAKLEMLKHNAKIYNVSDNIQMINCDFLQVPLQVTEKVDVLFASPPWGGPTYLNSAMYDLNNITPPMNQLLQTCAKLSNNVILYLPKTLDPIDFYECLINSGCPYSTIEFQVYFIGKNVKGIACFLGEIVHPNPEDVLKLQTS